MISEEKPYLWIVDSDRKPLEECLGVFDVWADIVYIGPRQAFPEWEEGPDAVFFSAEIAGGAEGGHFSELCREAGHIPLIAVARLRSLAQAVGFFRAGAIDYLSLPLEEDDVRERLDAALAKAATQTIQGMMVDLQPLDPDADQAGISLKPIDGEDEDEDILAHLQEEAISGSGEPIPAEPPMAEEDYSPSATEAPALLGESPEIADEQPDECASGENTPVEDGSAGEEEPEVVDGLPIPTLWEELPCGLLVFDSDGNLVFSNSLGLDLLGCPSLAELADRLENRLDDFKAHGANRKLLPDNQWPHLLAMKSRVSRSAVVSIERGDGRRLWLRIDCLPHLSEGKVNRLTMTLVNLTGELPPLVMVPPVPAPAPALPRSRGKPRGKRRK